MLSRSFRKVSGLWKGGVDYRLSLEKMDTAFVEPDKNCYLERCRVDNGAFVGDTAFLNESCAVVATDGGSMRYLEFRNLHADMVLVPTRF